jgi:hypothetical protein
MALEWTGHLACMEEKRSELNILVGTREGNRSF